MGGVTWEEYENGLEERLADQSRKFAFYFPNRSNDYPETDPWSRESRE